MPKRKASSISVGKQNETLPIFILNNDVWFIIALFLDFESYVRLIMTSKFFCSLLRNSGFALKIISKNPDWYKAKCIFQDSPPKILNDGSIRQPDIDLSQSYIDPRIRIDEKTIQFNKSLWFVYQEHEFNKEIKMELVIFSPLFSNCKYRHEFIFNTSKEESKHLNHVLQSRSHMIDLAMCVSDVYRNPPRFSIYGTLFVKIHQKIPIPKNWK
jgi:hypothetical protein